MPEDTAIAGDNPDFSADLDTTFADMPDAADDAEGDLGADAGDAGESDGEGEIEPLAAADEQGTEGDETAKPGEEAKPPEKLEEGVRMVERDGKKTFYLNESRYRTYEADHHLRTELEQRLVPMKDDGTTPTLDDIRAAIDLNERAHQGMREMDLDFISGDPNAQRKFINHFMEQGRQALASGEVPVDPMISLAGNLFDVVAQSHPEAYGQIAGRAANQMLEDIYSVAVTEQNKDLFYAAQHMEKLLFNRFHREDGTIVSAKQEQRRAPSFQAAPQQRQQQPANGNAQQAWTNYRVSTDREAKVQVQTKVTTALAKAKTAYEKAGLPETYEGAFERLNSQVNKELGDPNTPFGRNINNLLRQAAITVSEQKRQEIRAQIVKAHQNRAQLIIDAKLPAILAEANKATKQRLDASHERRAAAQNRRAPSGGGPAPTRSLIPNNGKDRSFEQDIAAIFG